MRLHVRGLGLPDATATDLWIVDGHISTEPIAGADTVFDGGWILPGLVDLHCHIGLGEHGGVEFDEAIAQAETERDVGVLLVRDCGVPIDTRSLDERPDLPRIIRAGRHLARPKRYIPGLAIDFEDESQLPAAVAEQAQLGDGWVKLVGDWIDRGVITATVTQKPYVMSYYGLKFLDDLHHNAVHQFTDWRTALAPPTPTSVDTGTVVVDKGNLKLYREALTAHPKPL